MFAGFTFLISPMKVRVALFLIFIILAVFIYREPKAGAQDRPPQKTFKPFAGKDWSKEKRANEAIARHEMNLQRLHQAAENAQQPEASGPTVTDTNDVSVIQDDGSILIPANLFNLTSKAVLFTPVGNSYSVTSGSSAFDTNLGTKLNLAASPAVNPKFGVISGVELGDDAYIPSAMSFNFPYYGTTYSTVNISSNGFVTFRPAGVANGYFDNNSADSGESLASLQSALPRIAPYWHDLDARAVATTGTTGIYVRNDSDRTVITWNNIADFPNTTSDNGIQRFQLILFIDGRIQFNYAQIQLTSSAVTGISAGSGSTSPQLVDFANPGSTSFPAFTPLAEVFAVSPGIDEVSAIKAFYTAHPGVDDYDFVHIYLDFNFTLSNNAFAYYAPIRNAILGNGQGAFDSDPYQLTGSTKIRGFMELGSLSQYPVYPTTRIPLVGANHFLSVMGQEQGHYWLAYVTYPLLSQTLLLGRDDEHWSFFMNTESTWSQPAARRSSNSEGNVWRDNGNGTFTSLNLIDGYSYLDQYLMGLRPSGQVPDTFVLINTSTPFGADRTTGPTPNITISGTKYPVTVANVIQSNGQVSPAPDGTQKKYRAVTLLIEQKGQSPTQASLDKLTRYRLAWESYFAKSTDYLASMNTGISAATEQRFIAVTDSASYSPVVVPAEICAIFGQGLTGGNSAAATPGQPLPTNIVGTEVRVDGVLAPLFYAGPFQINFQMPRTANATTTISGIGTVQSATANIEVYRNGQLVRVGAAQIAPVQTATFSISQDGTGAAAALDAITFAPAPFNAKQTNGLPNFIAVYLTGLGADVTDTAGDISSSVQVTLGGQPVAVQYAGQAPGYYGLNQVNFQLPAGITSGTYTLTVSRLGYPSNSTTITIK